MDVMMSWYYRPSSSLQRESEDAGQGLERPNTRPETTTSPPQPAPAPASAGAAPSAALTLEPCAHVQDPSDWFVVPKQTASVDEGVTKTTSNLPTRTIAPTPPARC